MSLNKSPFSVESLLDASGSSTLPMGVRVVKAFLATHEPVHRIYARQWFLNIANYVGNQNIVFNRAAAKFLVPIAPSWRVRLIVNKILPIARIQMAKLILMKLIPYVVPSTRSESDQGAAKTSTKLVKSIHENEDFNDIYRSLIHWLVLTGNVWLFPLYDETAGREVIDFETDTNGEPLLDEQGQKVQFSFMTGDLMFDLADPFEVIPDFSVTNFKEMSGIVKRKPRSVKYIKDKYGVEVQPENLNFGIIAELKTMALAAGFGIKANVARTMQHSAIVNDYYENPTKDHPRGRHFITAGDKQLFQGELTTKRNGEYTIPAVHFGAIMVPKRLLFMSPVENLLPLQWQYNRARSQIIEDINTLGRPKLFAPIDSIVDGAFTDEPGEVVEWDPAAGPAPFYGNPSGPPAVALDNVNRLDQEMQDVGGVHDISQGKLPRRATSGFALNILEEKDTTIIGPMKDAIRSGLQKVFGMALSIARDRFGEKRTLKIVDKEKLPDIIDFTGADLSSSDDVRLLMDDQFPQSRAAKLEFAQALVKEGIISPMTARKIIDIDDFANLSDVMLDDEQQRIIAGNVAEQQALAQQEAELAAEEPQGG